MKLSKTRIFGLVNSLMTGSLTFISFYVFSGVFIKDSRCEFCGIMLTPGIIFFAFLVIGLYTLFSSEQKLNSKKRLLNILNFSAIILSISAIVFNFIA